MFQIKLKIPKLNHILLPEIEKLAKRLNCTEITVCPIGNQNEFLVENGFVETTDIYYPSPIIMGSAYWEDYKDKMELIGYIKMMN